MEGSDWENQGFAPVPLTSRSNADTGQDGQTDPKAGQQWSADVTAASKCESTDGEVNDGPTCEAPHESQCESTSPLPDGDRYPVTDTASAMEEFKPESTAPRDINMQDGVSHPMDLPSVKGGVIEYSGVKVHAAELTTVEPHAAEPHAAEYHAAEHHAVELHAAEHHAVEPRAAEPHTVESEDLQTHTGQSEASDQHSFESHDLQSQPDESYTIQSRPGQHIPMQDNPNTLGAMNSLGNTSTDDESHADAKQREYINSVINSLAEDPPIINKTTEPQFSATSQDTERENKFVNNENDGEISENQTILQQSLDAKTDQSKPMECEPSSELKEKDVFPPDKNTPESPTISPSQLTDMEHPAGIGNVEANLLLHMYNKVLEENIEQLVNTKEYPNKESVSDSKSVAEDDIETENPETEMDQDHAESEELETPETVEETEILEVEAGQPFRQEICKALENVCRRMLMAEKFVRITGDLNFCIDEREAIKMPEVCHYIDKSTVHRAKRGRPRKNRLPLRKSNAPRAAKTEQPLFPKEEVPEGTDESREQVTTNSVEQSEENPSSPTESSPDKSTTYECPQCDYTTRHAGFYKKHQRTKHTKRRVRTELSQSSDNMQLPRKRGRPRKYFPAPSPKEDEEVVEDLQGGDSASDNEDDTGDTTFNPEGPINDQDEASGQSKRTTRSSGAGKFRCEECSYETDHSGHFRDHLNRHRGVKPHPCSKCSKSFIRIDDLRKHEEIHNRKYECTMCAAEFEYRASLKEHMKDVHNETGRLQLFPCDICKKNLPTHAELEKHMEVKHNHICVTCGENFTYVSQLKKHKNEQHPNETLTCTICLKRCASQGALRKHLHRHRAGNSFPCDICGRTFTAQSTLYHHKRGVHSDLKPYKCTQCEKCFNFHHSLKLHMLQHKGVRPYKCDVCEKTYLTATHLKSHKQAVHSESKKFVCVICNKRFPYENSLKMHMMLHTGDRPFLCNQCGRGFVTHSALKVPDFSPFIIPDQRFSLTIR